MLKGIAVVLALSGCSIALQSKPAKGGASKECHTTHVYWVADAVLAAASVAAMGYAIADGRDRVAAAGAGGVVGVLFMASAHNGYRWRGECVRGEPSHIATR